MDAKEDFSLQQEERFTIHGYFRILTGVFGEPRRFFSERAGNISVSDSVWFLILSSLLFSAASLIRHAPSRPILMGAVFAANGFGMALILAAFGYLVAVVLVGKRVTFGRFFSVYALSAGVTLLAAWIPFFIWITEPWKWWLIATGMKRTFGFKSWQGPVILGVSIPALALFFHSLLPFIVQK